MSEENYQKIFYNLHEMGGALYPLELGYSIYNSERKVGPRVRDSFLLHFLIDGSGSYNGTPISPGTGFLICPEQKHCFCYYGDQTWRHIWLAFAGKQAEAALHMLGLPLYNTTFTFTENKSQLESHIPFFYSDDNSGFFRMAGMMYKLFSLIKTTNIPQTPYVKQAQAFIQAQYANPVTIEQLANEIGISHQYLCRLFQEAEGMSAQEYLVRTRLSHASRLLRKTELTVTQIASSVGYPDPYHFSAIFKKYYGEAPQKHRKMT